jgi:hypothetical protein
VLVMNELPMNDTMNVPITICSIARQRAQHKLSGGCAEQQGLLCECDALNNNANRQAWRG